MISGRSTTARRSVRVTVTLALLFVATAAFAVPAQAAEPVNQKTFISGSNQQIPDAGQIGQMDSNITVSGLTGNVTDVDVSLYFVHTPASDMDAAVLSPVNSEFNPSYSYLFSQLGGTDTGYGQGCDQADRTTFDDSATDPIDSGTAPFVGSFKPSPNAPAPSPLSTFDGLTPSDANGVWSLNILNYGAAWGDFYCWSLFITTDQEGPVQFDNNTYQSIPPTLPEVESPIVVNNMIGNLASITVMVWIQHPNVSDLELTLETPTGIEITLAKGAGEDGNNYGTSCSGNDLTKFSDSSTNSLTNYAAPYVGTFRSSEPLSTLRGLSGSGLNGTWNLHVKDNKFDNTGDLKCWKLKLGTTALSVQPRMQEHPLRDAYSIANFLVTNTSDDTISNVTLKTTIPQSMKNLLAIPESFPNCSLANRVLTCFFASIPPRSSVTGGVIGQVVHSPAGNQVCLQGTASAPDIQNATGKRCFKLNSYPAPDTGTGYGTGKKAHNIRLKDSTGNYVSLSQFAGKYVLLQFTSRWCGPSMQEVPQDRDEIAALNNSNAMGVEVVFLSVLTEGTTPGVASKQSDATVWKNHFGLTTPVLHVTGDLKKIADSQQLSYGIAGYGAGAVFPTSVFIRPDGTIFDIRIGNQGPGDTTDRFMSDLP